MPIVEIHLIEGYSDADKSRLCTALTQAARLVVPAAPDAITVMVHELPPGHYMRGNAHRQPAPAKPDPSDVVRRYLAAMEARELKQATALLSDGFTMTFPGTAPMTTLDQLITWAGPRYRFVTKTYKGFDALQSESEAAVVYCRGTLAGEWPDGTAFGGIRFIDRFEVIKDKIIRQDVWNDIAETRDAP
ncbi:tautomerase family protein [Sulfitobacter sp.]|uniref:tautomerase family protein n=1 Tax=Sulfitobacter sp. TaxID=1903071 RepID=UPI0030026844